MAMAAVAIGGAVGLILPPRGRRAAAVSWGAGTGRRAAAVRASYEAGVGVMATKVGMMTYFDPATGKPVPVTVVGFREGGNVVTQVKTAATDGYDSVQVGYHGVREDKLTRPELGHLGKAGAPPLRHLQEFRLAAVDAFEPGQPLDFAELFKEGDIVDVSGNSIGKGFQGGIKRHNFKRGLMTHGSKSHRQLGSIGAGTTPGRVYKGKKMPGRWEEPRPRSGRSLSVSYLVTNWMCSFASCQFLYTWNFRLVELIFRYERYPPCCLAGCSSLESLTRCLGDKFANRLL